MTANVTISCDIASTDYSCPLGFEIRLDGETILDIGSVTGPSHAEFATSDADGEHELEFILKNKRPEHTQIDENNEIIKDANIIVANVEFDGIPLGQVLTRLTEYHHDFNGTSNAVVEKFYGEMGCNGTVSLNFSTPIYLWLLENV